jgi:hypothetical protein
MRKVIQIISFPETKDTNASVVALCDDGTMWEYTNEAKWNFVEPIPQDSVSVSSRPAPLPNSSSGMSNKDAEAWNPHAEGDIYTVQSISGGSDGRFS